MLELFYFPTPNCKKVVILLEECSMPYTITPVRINKGEQFAAEFLRISPNNRVPALIDHEPLGGGQPLALFESGAIMMYLAEKVGKFWPQKPGEKYAVVQWVLWQSANQGPKMGEQNHFHGAADNVKNGDQSYAISRFDNEVHRLFGVINLGLFGKEWLAGDDYSLADMACYPWASLWELRGNDITDFPKVEAWMQRIAKRPAVKRAMAIGINSNDETGNISQEERERRAKILSNQRAIPIPPQWYETA